MRLAGLSRYRGYENCCAQGRRRNFPDRRGRSHPPSPVPLKPAEASVPVEPRFAPGTTARRSRKSKQRQGTEKRALEDGGPTRGGTESKRTLLAPGRAAGILRSPRRAKGNVTLGPRPVFGSITGRRRGRRRSRSGLGSAQIPFRGILGNIKDDDFVRRPGSVDVELDRLANGSVLLFDVLVIRDYVDRVLVLLGVRLLQLHLDRPNLFRGLRRLAEREFENIAFSEAPQLLHLIMIPGDQAALNAEVTLHAGHGALGRFQIRLGGVEIGLRSTQLGRNLSELGGGVRLNGAKLLAKLLITFLLL